MTKRFIGACHRDIHVVIRAISRAGAFPFGGRTDVLPRRSKTGGHSCSTHLAAAALS
jgi:hypothetical protein